MPGGDAEPIVYQAVSIGQTCQVKFQIARTLNRRGWPGRSEMALRLDMVPPHRGERNFGWDVFDWLGVSLEAVCGYIEADFQDVFRLEDLELGPDVVIDRKTGSNHVHDFEPNVGGFGGTTWEMVEAQYSNEKAKFDRRAKAFLERLRQPGPALYCHMCTDFPEPELVERLIAALSSRSSDHRFHLLFYGWPDFDQDYGRFEGLVSKAWRPRSEDKPAERAWEGHDAAWDAALEPFELAPHPGVPRKVAAPAAPPEPAAEARKPKLFSRLLGRG